MDSAPKLYGPRFRSQFIDNVYCLSRAKLLWWMMDVCSPQRRRCPHYGIWIANVLRRKSYSRPGALVRDCFRGFCIWVDDEHPQLFFHVAVYNGKVEDNSEFFCSLSYPVSVLQARTGKTRICIYSIHATRGDSDKLFATLSPNHPRRPSSGCEDLDCPF